MHWASSVVEREGHEVVVVPISVRFGTASRAHTVRSMLQALQKTSHGDEKPSMDPQNPGESLQTYLSTPRSASAKPLLVVLDGLDEASDWSPGEFLGSSAARDIKILASARQTATRNGDDWRRILGWRTEDCALFELSPLDRGGVGEVLVQKVPDAADFDAFVEALYAKTQGEPLTLRLYCDDLHASATASQLADSPPGLHGYFQTWWEMQRSLWKQSSNDVARLEEACKEVMGVLSVALGPLSPKDIQSILPQSNVQEALNGVDRFVVRTSDDERCMLAHPKLAIYIQEMGWRRLDALMQWANGQLEALTNGRLAPNALSEYVLRHLGEHLEEQGDVKGLRALLTQPWKEAWEHRDGSLEGFLADAERAWRMFEGLEAPDGEQMVRLGARSALIRASCASRTRQLPPELPALLVEDDLWSDEVALFNTRHPSRGYQAETLSQMTPHLRGDTIAELFEDLTGLKVWGETPGQALAQIIHRAHALELVDLQGCMDTLASIEPAKIRAQAAATLCTKASFKAAGAQLSERLLADHKGVDRGIHAAAMLIKALRVAPAALRPRLMRTIDHRIWDDDEGHDKRTLGWMAKGGEVDAALDLALKQYSAFPKINALAAVIPHLPSGAAKDDAYGVWWSTLEKEATHHRFDQFGVPLPLEAPWQDRYLSLMQTVASPAVKAICLARLARHHPQRVEEACLAVEGVQGGLFRAFAADYMLPVIEAERRETWLTQGVTTLFDDLEGSRGDKVRKAWQAWPDVRTEPLESWWFKPYVSIETHICRLLRGQSSAMRRQHLLVLLGRAHKIDDGHNQAGMVGRLMEDIAPKERPKLLKEALERTKGHPKGAFTMQWLLPYTPNGAQERLSMACIDALPDKIEGKDTALAFMVPFVPGKARQNIQKRALDAWYARTVNTIPPPVATLLRRHATPSELEAMLESLKGPLKARNKRQNPRHQGDMVLMALELAREGTKEHIKPWLKPGMKCATERKLLFTPIISSPIVSQMAPELEDGQLEALVEHYFPQHSPQMERFLGSKGLPLRAQAAILKAIANRGAPERAYALARTVPRDHNKTALMAPIAGFLQGAPLEEATRYALGTLGRHAVGPGGNVSLLNTVIQGFLPSQPALWDTFHELAHRERPQGASLETLVLLYDHGAAAQRLQIKDAMVKAYAQYQLSGFGDTKRFDAVAQLLTQAQIEALLLQELAQGAKTHRSRLLMDPHAWSGAHKTTSKGTLAYCAQRLGLSRALAEEILDVCRWLP